MEETLKLDKALEELRKSKERKFDQTIELIVNLKKFDIKKNSINTFIIMPNKIKDKKICGFIEIKSELIDTIPKGAFPKYKDKKELKKLVKKYDFFISSGPNMPAVATIFGRVLGPAGKMPSPKLGIIMNESDSEVKKLITRINNIVKIHTKEPSVKISIGKVSMSDDKIIENVKIAYESIVSELPNKKDNIKTVLLKLTMSKPIKIEI